LISDKQNPFFNLVPRAQFQYSNPAYGVLQQVVEDCTQKHFYEVAHENVFTKLGMTKSTFKQPIDEQFENYASAGHNVYRPLQEKRYYTPNEAAGGLWTTVDDFAKYLIEIQLSVSNKSNKIISQELAQEMTSPQITNVYGLGLFMRKVTGEQYFGHMGDTRGFFAGFLADTKHGNGVIVFTNSHESPELIREITKSVAYVYNWKGFVEEPIEVVSLPIKSLEKYAGKYKTGFDNALTISFKDDELVYDALNEKMYCIARDTFKIKRRAGYFAFTRNTEGDIDGVSYLVADDLGRMPANEYSGKRMEESELLPSEILLTENYKDAIEQYKLLFEQNSSDRAVSENRFNRMGYNLLQQKKLPSALAIFKLNTELYPGSWNVFDSYGEALALTGRINEAIQSYEEAIRINPAALNSKDRLELLMKKK
jgi:tetratricopeptide (TPR) repeat protein